MVVVLAMCVIAACLLCSCQSSPSFGKSTAGAPDLSGLVDITTEFAEGVSIPDSLFDEAELAEAVVEESEDATPSSVDGDNSNPAAPQKNPDVVLPSDYPEAEYVEQTVLVNPAEGVGMAEVAQALGVDVSKVMQAGVGYYAVDLPSTTDTQAALESLQVMGGIEAAQPDFVYHILDEEPTSIEGDSATPAVEEADAEAADDSPAANAVMKDPEGDLQDQVIQDETVPTEEGIPPEETLAAFDAEDSTDDTTQDEPQPSPDAEDEPQAQAEEPNADDTYLSSQWSLESINAFGAWDILRNANPDPVTIAVIDAGAEVTHEDLVGNLMFDNSGALVAYNSLDGSNDVPEVDKTARIYGHGTHVAGILAASVNNGKGVAGVSHNQRIYPVKVFDSEGSATTRSLLAAYLNVVANMNKYGIRVVNMSVGSTSADSALKSAIDAAYEAGVVSVAASGNDGLTRLMYPCDFDNVVGVINLAQSGNADGVEKGEKSNYNAADAQTKEISAPGSNIYSTLPGGEYGFMSGTSMAAPCVSGVLGMMFAVNPNLSADQAINILYSTARDLGEEGFDPLTGHGEVDAAAAVAAAQETVGEYTFDDQSAQNISDLHPQTLSYISTATIASIPAQYYAASGAKPKLSITSATGLPLSEGVDYTVRYEDNKEVGIATAVVSGIGMYTGNVEYAFQIIEKPVYTLGATRMPVSSTSAWKAMNCSLKVVSGTDVVSIANDGVTVKAKAKGTATIAILDELGRQVKTQKVTVYKLSGSYFLQSAKKTSLNVSVKGKSKASNAQAVVAKKKNHKSQKVKFYLSNGYYQIKLAHSGKRLSVKSSSKKQNAPVVQTKKSSKKSQQWKISVDSKNRLTFTNRKSGKVLVIKGSVKSGASLVQRASTASLREKWNAVKAS